MILAGILHYSLGGVAVIRGVAPLRDLARCSRFDPAYQRNLIETHRQEIERFLADREYLFFPEVVLSASLDFDYEKYHGRRDVRPLGDLFGGHAFRSNVNGLSVRVVKTRPPNAMPSGGPAAPTLAYLELPEDQLDSDDGLRLFRIDGNHRLSVIDLARPAGDNDRLPTPFCIVLHQDAATKQRFEKVVFHNINAKQIPLTSEENLRLILQDGDDALFTDDKLLTEPSFGLGFWLARHLLAVPEMDKQVSSGFTKHLANPCTLALGIAQFLLTRKELPSTDNAEALAKELPRIRKALKEVNARYEAEDGEHLREGGGHGLLTAFVYFAVKNAGRQLSTFAHWIETNRIDRLTPANAVAPSLGYHYHLGQTQAVDPGSLVDVFGSVLTARSRKVFVSMQFGQNPGQEPVYKAIAEAVQAVNNKHGLKAELRLQPIRIDHVNKGHSYTISQEILKVVEGCGLLIADLSEGNKNVYHEVGFLMGLNQGRGGLQDNFVLLVDSNKVREDAAVGFNLRSWQQLRFADPLDLKNQLVASLEKHFALTSA